jgi:hypothetical protein
LVRENKNKYMAIRKKNSSRNKMYFDEMDFSKKKKFSFKSKIYTQTTREKEKNLLL